MESKTTEMLKSEQRVGHDCMNNVDRFCDVQAVFVMLVYQVDLVQGAPCIAMLTRFIKRQV